jgi:ribonuclease HII
MRDNPGPVGRRQPVPLDERVAGFVCGVDEAGRGPLAGAVFAAAVVLDAAAPIAGLADSKILSARVRERLELEIKKRAIAWSVAEASVEEIDDLNILQATLLAMRRAVETLPIAPGQALIDGLHCPALQIPARAIVRGDSSVPEIAAASILAKTARDRAMQALHLQYPDYGLDRHKGYPTAAHLEALARLGATPSHRRSFAPVSAAINSRGNKK